MPDYLEAIAKVIYREWKSAGQFTGENHPDEESLACFAENKLSGKDKEIVQKHLISCNICAEYVSVQLKIQPHLSLDLPLPLEEKIKNMVIRGSKENLFEIFLKLKDKALEIIQTSGDVLVGQELIPAPVLRSRQINEFKEEISILKDIQQLRVLAKIQNKNSKKFSLAITVKDKLSQKTYKNLRITLIKDEIELESYMTDSGSSFFENIPPGDYLVEVSREGQKIAVIGLKVKA